MTGQDLKDWRAMNGKRSQSWLADVLGYKRRQVARWEDDEPPPPKWLDFALPEIARQIENGQLT